MEAENHSERYVSTFTFTAAAAERTEGVVTFDAQPRIKAARVLNMITSAVAARSVAKTLEADLKNLCTAVKKLR